jgi:hypothetical protein
MLPDTRLGLGSFLILLSVNFLMCSTQRVRSGSQSSDKDQPPLQTGPNPGRKIPDFQAFDQNGRLRTLENLLGPKGALLVFFRSADW